MKISQIVISCVMGLFSVGSFVIAFFQNKETGPVFTNTFLYATRKERETMDKKPEYRLARNVFIMFGAVFFLVTLYALLSLRWLIYPVIALIVVIIVYAIVYSVKNVEFK